MKALMFRKFATVLLLPGAVLGYAVLTNSALEPVRRTAQSAGEWVAATEAPDVVSRLRMSLSAFDGNPSTELAYVVMEAFEAVDDRLADLQERAAVSTGGLRAELVIERIELERERAAQMQRFSDASAQVIESGEDESDGLRYATSMVTGSLGGE